MAKETFFPRLSALASQLGITLCEKQLEQFYTYYTFLVEKNKVMNLTAITEEEDVIVKHFVDSLALQVKHFPTGVKESAVWMSEQGRDFRGLF